MIHFLASPVDGIVLEGEVLSPSGKLYSNLTQEGGLLVELTVQDTEQGEWRYRKGEMYLI